MSTDLVTRTAEKTLFDVIAANKKTLDAIIPAHLGGDRFLRLLVGAIRKNPALTQCTPGSFINSVLTATSLGLEIRPNSAYLIPFGQECQLLIDYRGKMDLARRSGKIGVINAKLVHAHDEFSYGFDPDRGERFEFKPRLWMDENGTRIPIDPTALGPVILGFAWAEIIGSKFFQATYMLHHEIEAIRKRSPSVRRQKSSPWDTDWEQMALKTVIHRLCKFLPQSPELALSQDVDDAVMSGEQLPPIVEIEAPEIPMFTGSRELQEKVGEEKIRAMSGREFNRQPEAVDTGATPIIDTDVAGEALADGPSGFVPLTQEQIDADEKARIAESAQPRPTMANMAAQRDVDRSRPKFRRTP